MEDNDTRNYKSYPVQVQTLILKEKNTVQNFQSLGQYCKSDYSIVD